MELGQKVKFQKELIKGGYKNRSETKEFYEKYRTTSENRHWGVRDNGKITEGIMCGKRRIDMDGGFTGDEESYWYEFGNQETVYLIATDVRGFHRVPKEFILD